MFKKAVFLFLIFLVMACEKREKPQVSIIPRPEKYWVSSNTINFDRKTRIIYEDPNPALRLMADDLALQIGKHAAFTPEVVALSQAKSIGNDITLTINLADSAYGNEGYKMEHNGMKFLSIQANNAKGIFYGIQSFLQLLPSVGVEKPDEIVLPSIYIEDKPRFSYRGMHLDVGRHFFPVSFVKQYIDLMAMYKFNTLHWHLTEDQGWRIEIKKYPKLTEVGAWRDKTIVGHQVNENKVFDNLRYGGFYTQEEIREVVDYAALKQITIIPEIEMPGHSLAALAAYPEMGCSGGPYQVAGEWGVFDDVYCTKEQTFTFLEDILTEVIGLFPGTYIHIGGDEVPKTRWKNCPSCQKRMKSEKLKTEQELQSYFVRRIEKFLASHNRRIIGWDEILEGGLAPEATVMSWRGITGGIDAAQMGHDVIMTPGDVCYFDHYQGDSDHEPLAIGGLTKVSEVYAYEPVPEELSPNRFKYILGAQANVWTEYLTKPEDVTYMVLPRMAALSEVVWSPKEKREWSAFYKKLPYHFALYKEMGLHYSQSVNNLYFRIKLDENKVNQLNIETEIPDAVIRYTTNDSMPSVNSKKWIKALPAEEVNTIHAAAFIDGKQIGEVFSKTISK
ncbi:MAG: family 20 glycosylhydrolase [Bacteroidales bacterium]|nr:family 20 glycosylhydrolase [Bacteroidales bacterium]